MALSFFTEKGNHPTEKDLEKALGSTYAYWKVLYNFLHELYSKTEDQWNYAGEKYGWGFRLREKKRVLIYLIPCDGYFKVGLVFGEKATVDCRKSKISPALLQIINEARVYAEGRAFRIDIKDETYIEDLKLLLEIKLRY